MAYDWKYVSHPPMAEDRHFDRLPRTGRAGWLTRLFAFLNDLLGFTKKAGDYNRKV